MGEEQIVGLRVAAGTFTCRTRAYHPQLDLQAERPMHAWLCENPTGVDAMQWKELPTPQPRAGEVLIEIKAASLNFPDILIVQNKYQMKPALPFVPGSEYAGNIAAEIGRASCRERV